MDNNTPDETTWRPLEALCRELGPNFKCLHLDGWPGYKSGALNFALTQTAPDAEIIGIIDADYQVSPEFLRETLPYFSNPRVAFLQTPQDYREYEGSAYLEACYDAYRYFFEVSMPSRDEHNAIIFGGTMGLIRKSVLQDIGGWDEWCITEDAEASLRILKRGYRSIYVNQTYGRGLMPLNFEGLKKQRFRWCFGGIQILRKHWEALMPWARWADPANRLTPAQQYHYLAGGAQWYNEPLTLAFTVLLLLGGVATVFDIGIGVRPLQGALVVVPLIFLVLGVWRFLWALRHTLKLGWGRALRAMGSFFSLSWVVTLGSLQGLIQPRGVFLRTPKARSRSGLVRALRMTQWECGFGVTCAGIGLALIVTHVSLMAAVVTLLLFWQAGFYLAAPAYSLISVRGEVQPVRLTSRGDIQGRMITESRASRWAFALIVLLLIGYGLMRLLPEPAATPKYAQLQPVAIQPQELIGLPPLPTATRIPRASPTTVPASASPTPSALPSRPAQQFPTPTLPFISPPTGTPPPAQPPAETQPPPTGTSPTQTTTQPPAAPPLLTPTSTQRPLPTQAPTQRPLPTQVPTQSPLPTQAPTQPPQPTQPPLPTQSPIPTRPPRPA